MPEEKKENEFDEWFKNLGVKKKVILFIGLTTVLSIVFIVIGNKDKMTACDCANILADRTTYTDKVMNKALDGDGKYDLKNETWGKRARTCMKKYTNMKKWEIEAHQGMGSLIAPEAIENARRKCK